MKSHAPWATGLAIAFAFAACQSVRTQGDPAVTSDPNAIISSSAPSGDATASPSPEAVDTPTPVPPTPTPTPKPRQHVYNSVDVDGPYIAITFDDGPHPKLTPQLLDLLKARGIPATFFVVGKSVAEYPEIVQRMDAEGHEVANHTWNHPSLTKLGAAGVKSQMDRTDAAIVKAIGKRPTIMRPPYGATNARLNRALDEDYGQKVIMWSVDPQDWKYRNASRVTEQILSKTQAGGIVLAHDIHASTIAAMPATLDGLTRKGFKFVTVSQLLAMEKGRAPAQSTSVSPTPAASPTATPFVIQRVEPLP